MEDREKEPVIATVAFQTTFFPWVCLNCVLIVPVSVVELTDRSVLWLHSECKQHYTLSLY